MVTSNENHWIVPTLISSNYPPASEVSREVANLTERKNPHAPVYGVKEFVCLLQYFFYK